MSPREMSLHSTMFLLIRNRATKIRNYNPALHSTMFLLIQFDILTQKIKRAVFTFHDVSINTLITFFQPCYKSTLHSTMFLLIRKWQKQLTQTLMTLHSTMFLLIPQLQYYQDFTLLSLHSTMFLLIPVVYSSLQYRYNLTTFCQSCHFIIFILIFIFLDSSHF